MSNPAQDFLEYIIAHPDDDTARLVFADWLEEEGDSDRAEFIRVQIERARLPEWDARQVRLRLRESELLRQHGQRWMDELPNIMGIVWGEFRRGFMATAEFESFAVFADSASNCWAAAPIEAVITRWPRWHEVVENIPPIAGLRELTINEIFNADPSRLAHAPLLSTLRTLNIQNCNLGTQGFRWLLASPHLGNLTALRVPSNFIGNAGISALFDAASLTFVEELDLSETYGHHGEEFSIDAASLAMLAAWPGMVRVRCLNLSGHNVGRDGLRALLHSPHASGLKELHLARTWLDGQAMQEFGAAQRELQLDMLALYSNQLGGDGAAALARAACLRELKYLDLDSCDIGVAGVRELAKAPFLASLRQLYINNNCFGLEGLHALLEAKPPELHTLCMANNNLGAAEVSLLAQSPASDTLLEVDLSMNELGDQAALALAKSKHLRNLLVLRLNYTQISKASEDALARSPLGKRLAVLETANPEYVIWADGPSEEIPF